ncbi:MAG: hypothetical protein GAK31_00236 [Stenotrophomonas maltophilia]|uniref:MoaF-like domain-containing protein n=1 Tax=Stenotrophomonas maltophilia TaxID=40324 RepID=A0A7V8JMQ6_STEMA|nr:MAG: hypothetical protein GAK31_00236 [Stenotrophomonas maltophilia]
MHDSAPHAAAPVPVFAGRRFRVSYDGLAADNRYSDDGRHVHYAISWQEADGATVVHVDDFGNGRSLAWFTANDGSFHRMQGTLQALA